MASTPIQFYADTGLTLNIKLFALDSDVEVADISLTESTNRTGNYLGTVTEALDGWYQAVVLSGSDLLANGYYRLEDDTDTYHFKETVENVAGVSPEEALRRIGGTTAGVIENAGSDTETARDFAGNAMTFDVDADGNRSNPNYNA